MKLNKFTSALILSLGMASVGAQADVDGRVTFTGAIIDAACSIHPDSVDQVVELGSVSSSTLATNGKSRERPFKIILENCALATDDGGDDEDETKRAARAASANQVSVKFDGIQDDDDETLLSIYGAAGAGVAIANAGGQQINIGDESGLYPLTAGTNKLDFVAYLKSTEQEVETGEFTALASFILNYQ
ncbi:type 1 fimbrial protein [Kosakonia sacchari]|uniref:fimbrial protein n=1 Tax=Kosakonia sacchari TaxID=1158459 RepID=UPI002ACEE4D2|nr:fimbrial protein [Kosakonia sacchari]MDZ7320049.1 type 1 fimbrial protein [Kosakonia sacchari]